MKLVSQSLVRRVVGPSSGSSWPYFTHNHYMPGTTTKLSMPFQVLLLWFNNTLEISFLGLGLTVTEINIKKVQKQDLKSIKNVKRCRDGMLKSMQTR